MGNKNARSRYAQSRSKVGASDSQPAPEPLTDSVLHIGTVISNDPVRCIINILPDKRRHRSITATYEKCSRVSHPRCFLLPGVRVRFREIEHGVHTAVDVEVLEATQVPLRETGILDATWDGGTGFATMPCGDQISVSDDFRYRPAHQARRGDAIEFTAVERGGRYYATDVRILDEHEAAQFEPIFEESK